MKQLKVEAWAKMAWAGLGTESERLERCGILL
jgi:hypothetical protein